MELCHFGLVQVGLDLVLSDDRLLDDPRAYADFIDARHFENCDSVDAFNVMQ